jgi:hypothetical protein
MACLKAFIALSPDHHQDLGIIQEEWTETGIERGIEIEAEAEDL